MYKAQKYVLLLATALILASCSRDPNVAKVRYLESGNRYFQNGRYKEARIKYRNALQKDMKYGMAYYWLGQTEFKLGTLPAAVNAFRRAKDELKDSQPEYWDATARLAEILVTGGGGNRQFLEEAQGYCDKLLKHDPNSFDGHRLVGDLNFIRAVIAMKPSTTAASQTANASDLAAAKTYLDAAIDEFRKANSIKPGQTPVMLQLARAVATRGEFASAEELYRQIIQTDKTKQEVYTELYKVYLIQRKVDEGEKVLKLAFQNNPKQYSFLTLLAVHYSMQRRTQDMMGVLQQIKSNAKEFPDAYLVVGEFYLRLGDLDSAVKEYQDGMAKDPKKKVAYQHRIVEALLRQGKRREAADLNAAILKADPNDNDAKSLAATFLLDSGDINRAVTELQTVVTRAPDNAVARYQLGRAYAALQQLEQARQMFMKAIELRPDYVQARLALAEIQILRQEYDAALKTAAAVLQADRGNMNARLIESSALMGQKKYSDSRSLLDAMAKANPNSPDVYFQMGMVALAENKFKEAEDTFRKAYQLNPANSRGLMGIVETNLAQNKTEEALRILQTEADKAPNRLEFRIALAKAAVKVGRYDMGVQEYKKVLDAMDKNSKDRAQIYAQIGETYRRKGNDSDAIANLQKAREMMPESSQILTILGLTYDHAGKHPEAKQVYEAAIKMDPSGGVAFNNLAFLIAEDGGDLDDALTKATRAKQLLPNMPEVSDTLGWIYLKKNLYDDAVRIFQELVTRAPNQATYRYHLGMAFNQKGDRPKAIKALQEALKNNPTGTEKQKIQDMLTRLNGAA